MKNVMYLLAIPLFTFAIQACQNKQAKNYNVQTDQDGIVFIKTGIESGLTEIKASGLAITNSNNQKVIALAKMMIDDHTKAGDELKKLETDKKITEKDTINQAHLQSIDSLGKLKGSAFDKAYIGMMVNDHVVAVKLFTNASHNIDSQIKQFASETLPVLQMHLDSAKSIQRLLK